MSDTEADTTVPPMAPSLPSTPPAWSYVQDTVMSDAEGDSLDTDGEVVSCDESYTLDHAGSDEEDSMLPGSFQDHGSTFHTRSLRKASLVSRRAQEYMQSRVGRAADGTTTPGFPKNRNELLSASIQKARASHRASQSTGPAHTRTRLPTLVEREEQNYPWRKEKAPATSGGPVKSMQSALGSASTTRVSNDYSNHDRDLRGAGGNDPQAPSNPLTSGSFMRGDVSEDDVSSLMASILEL